MHKSMLAALAATGAVAASAARSATLTRNARIFDGRAGTTIAGDGLVVGNTIRRVGQGPMASSAIADADVIDAGGSPNAPERRME